MVNKHIDFPQLQKTNLNQKRFVYLDSAATTQKPNQVLNAVTSFYESINANPHRGAYDASMEATKAMDSAREKVSQFIGATNPEQIVFCKNATEAINLVAYSYGENFLQSGDEIVLCISEHHSNILPWQHLAKKKNLVLTYMHTNNNTILTTQEIDSKIGPKTKLVALAHVCNTTGVVYPIEYAIAKAHEVGAVALIDATQSVPHMKVDFSKLNADFLVFSGHKMLAPMGIGVLVGKQHLLEKMPPFLLGGDMVEYVEEQSATFAPVPQRYEAGTANVGSIVGLHAAISYIESIGMQNIESHEKKLTNALLCMLDSLDFVTIIGPKNSNERLGIVSFVVNGVHAHDVASILNFENVAIRAGNHCAQPFHKFLKLNATCRASIYLYNNLEDIEALKNALIKVRKVLI